jgi:hypothetical protein
VVLGGEGRVVDPGRAAGRQPGRADASAQSGHLGRAFAQQRHDPRRVHRGLWRERRHRAQVHRVVVVLQAEEGDVQRRQPPEEDEGRLAPDGRHLENLQ